MVMLDTQVSPILIFAFYAELPSAWTLCGGALLLIALVAHEMGEDWRSGASVFSWRAGAGGLSAVKRVDSEATAASRGSAAARYCDDAWSTDSDERTPQLSPPGGLRLPERLPNRAAPVGGGGLAGSVDFSGVPYRAFSRESAPDDDDGAVCAQSETERTHSRSL